MKKLVDNLINQVIADSDNSDSELVKKTQIVKDITIKLLNARMTELKKKPESLW
jgi:hypothetical protein